MPRAVIRIRPEPAYRRAAITEGLKRIGYDIVDGTRERDWTPVGRDDLLVLWNRKQGTDERMAEVWEARGGVVLVVENGYLQKVDKTHYAISVGQHNGLGWYPISTTEGRFAKLGFALKEPVVRPEGYLLVIGQRGIGSKRMASPALWAEKQMAGLGNKNARLRPHPGNFKPRVPLLTDLAGARAVRIWSSSAGVLALVEGLPVSHCAPGWICANPNRELALEHMAQGQWNTAEITAGEPFARMKKLDWGRF